MDELDCYIPKKIVHVYNGGKKMEKILVYSQSSFFQSMATCCLVVVWMALSVYGIQLVINNVCEVITVIKRLSHFRQADGVDFPA